MLKRIYVSFLVIILLLFVLSACTPANSTLPSDTQIEEASTSDITDVPTTQAEEPAAQSSVPEKEPITPTTSETAGTEEQVSTEADIPPTETSTEQTFNRDDYSAAYATILADYKNIILFRLSDTFSQDWSNGVCVELSDMLQTTIDNNSDLANRWDTMIVELPNSSEAEDINYYGYILYDLNADNTPELFLVRADHSIAAIFTYYNEQIVLLDAFWSRSRACITQDGRLFTNGSNGAADNHYYFKSLTNNGQLVRTYGFFSQSVYADNSVEFFEFNEGDITPISQEEYVNFYSTYPFEQSEFWLNIPVESLN